MPRPGESSQQNGDLLKPTGYFGDLSGGAEVDSGLCFTWFGIQSKKAAVRDSVIDGCEVGENVLGGFLVGDFDVDGEVVDE